MKKLLTVLTALLVATGIAQAGIEVLGIEVLGIEVLGIEVLGIEVLAAEAPPGSTVEAWVVLPDGIEVLSDMQPLDPMTFTATVMMPGITPGSYVLVRNPDGTVFGIEVLR